MLRHQVIHVYKGRVADPVLVMCGICFSDSHIYPELLSLGKEYPLGYDYFRSRLHRAFKSQSHLQDEADILKAIERAQYVQREIEAL